MENDRVAPCFWRCDAVQVHDGWLTLKVKLKPKWSWRWSWTESLSDLPLSLFLPLSLSRSRSLTLTDDDFTSPVLVLLLVLLPYYYSALTNPSRLEEVNNPFPPPSHFPSIIWVQITRGWEIHRLVAIHSVATRRRSWGCLDRPDRTLDGIILFWSFLFYQTIHDTSSYSRRAYGPHSVRRPAYRPRHPYLVPAIRYRYRILATWDYLRVQRGREHQYRYNNTDRRTTL